MPGAIECGKRHEDKIGVCRRRVGEGFAQPQGTADERVAAPPNMEGERLAATGDAGQGSCEPRRRQGGEQRQRVGLTADWPITRGDPAAMLLRQRQALKHCPRDESEAHILRHARAPLQRRAAQIGLNARVHAKGKSAGHRSRGTSIPGTYSVGGRHVPKSTDKGRDSSRRDR